MPNTSSKSTLATLFPDVAAQWNYERNQHAHTESSSYPLTPQETAPYSNKMAWWKCEEGHEWEAMISNRVQGRGCPECKTLNLSVRIRQSQAQRNPLSNHPIAAWYASEGNVFPLEMMSAGSSDKAWFICPQKHSFERSVRTQVKIGLFCDACEAEGGISESHPELVKLWDHSKNKQDPSILKATYTKPLYWSCETCGSSLHERIRSLIFNYRHHNTYCLVCSNKMLREGINDFATTHPELATQLQDQDEGKSFTSLDQTVRTWVCDQHGCYTTTPRQRVAGVICKTCTKLQTGRLRSLAATEQNPLPANISDLWDDERNGDLRPEMVSALSSHQLIHLSYPCGHKRATNPRNIKQSPECSKCNMGTRTSKPQEELVTFVKDLLGDTQVFEHDRTILKTHELDIYVPSRQIAIEFNGLYWHSESARISSTYHAQKTSQAFTEGVQLIHVWEDDWTFRQEIVKQMLTHKLGVVSTVDPITYARKTLPQVISRQEAVQFLQTHHIQGSAYGSTYLGLRTKLEDELVAVMVLKKVAGIADQWLISRYATARRVPGGFSKLVSFTQQHLNPQSLITFSDNTVSDGGLYMKNGFTKLYDLAPDYRYVVGKERVHKYNYRLKRFREDENLIWAENKTERELADLNRLARIWDAGKVKWIKSFR